MDETLPILTEIICKGEKYGSPNINFFFRKRGHKSYLIICWGGDPSLDEGVFFFNLGLSLKPLSPLALEELGLASHLF